MDESCGAPQEYTAEEWAAWRAEQAPLAGMSPPPLTAPPPTSLLPMAAPPASQGQLQQLQAWFRRLPPKGLALMLLRCFWFEVSSHRNMPCRVRRHS